MQRRIVPDARQQAPAGRDDARIDAHLRPDDHAFHAQHRLLRHLIRRSEMQARGHVAEIALGTFGNENWEFADNGLMQRRYACLNDMPIRESERKFHWPLGRRPDGHPGLSDLGL